MTRLVVENAGLIFWPVVSLLIFAAALVFMLAWIFRPGSGRFYRNISRLPVDEDTGEKAEEAEKTGKAEETDKGIKKDKGHETGDASSNAQSRKTRNGGNRHA